MEEQQPNFIRKYIKNGKTNYEEIENLSDEKQPQTKNIQRKNTQGGNKNGIKNKRTY